MRNTSRMLTRRAVVRTLATGALAAAAARPVLAAVVAKLGEREIMTLSDGALRFPAAAVARDHGADEVSALLRANNLPADIVSMPLNVTAIRDGDAWTFIDCGAGDRFLSGTGQLAQALEGAGVDRDKVRDVIFTHGHPDHLWGAIDDMDGPLFPNARYRIAATERDFWLAPTQAPEDQQMLFVGAQRIIRQLGDRLTTFAPGQEVAPGVMALDTGGHTAGHVSLEVRGASQSLVVLGDALTHPVVSFAHPDWRPANDMDAPRAAATRARLLARLADEKLPVIGYHLPAGGFGRVERKDGAYRFVAG